MGALGTFCRHPSNVLLGRMGVEKHERTCGALRICVSGRIADPRPSRKAAEAAVRTLIRWAGDDPAATAFDTPARVVRAYEE